jgi:NTP pyrophosphatase (non-canonical NTP hydrolase)
MKLLNKDGKKELVNKFIKMKQLSEANREILLIAQEECAEVTQAISKVFRFGMDYEYNGETNREHLEEEIGDLMCMIDLLIDNGIVSESAVMTAKNEKLNKLLTWSTIFKETA